MSRKKKRGVSTLYSESKVKVGVSLTPTGAKLLSATAKELGLSRSEFVERIARGDFHISSDGQQATTVTLATDATAANSEPGENQTVSPTSQVRSPASEELQQRHAALEERGRQQADTIRDLEQKLAKLAELETQLENSISADAHRQLQDELNRRQTSVGDLKKRIEELETQLKTTVSAQTYQTLEKETQKEKATIQKLRTQLARLDELEARLRDTVSLKTHRTLQQELERHEATVTELQKQLKASVALDAYRELEKQLEWHKATVAQLQAQLVASVSADTHRQLEQKLGRQKTVVTQLQEQCELGEVQIAELQEQIKQLSDLEVRLAHSVPDYQYIALQEHSEHQRQILAGIREQLWELATAEDGLEGDSKIPLKRPETAESLLNCCQRVKQKLEAQVRTIAALQTRVKELQGLATVAESHLNKWSHRTFTSSYR